ncbi:MAG: hypothetical protein FWC80_00435 [Firmicutes bacterium]|nr:hypothetical protein [Bacillota bacterium]
MKKIKVRIIVISMLIAVATGLFIFMSATSNSREERAEASASINMTFNAMLRHEFSLNGNLMSSGAGGGGTAQSSIMINAVTVGINNDAIIFTTDAVFNNAIREVTLRAYINGNLHYIHSQLNPNFSPPNGTMVAPFSHTVSNLWDRDCIISFHIRVVSTAGGAFWDFNYFSTNVMNARINTTTPTGTFTNAVRQPSGRYYSNASMPSPRFSWDNPLVNQPAKYATINGVPYQRNSAIETDGIYTIVLRNEAGRQAIFTLVVDKTPPVNAALPEFTNQAINFYATDVLTGVVRVFHRRGSIGGFTIVTGSSVTIEAIMANVGRWYFYAEDGAGNTSPVISVFLDLTKPQLTIFDAMGQLSSGAYTNNGFVSFSASDLESGIAGMFVRLPNTANFIPYTEGTRFFEGGRYYFFAVDRAGNVAETISVTLDTCRPIGTLYAGGIAILNGASTNLAIRFSAVDSVSGIARKEVMRPSGTWTIYNGEIITTNSGDGWYTFRAIDRAGNMSDEYKAYLLTERPSVQLFANESPVDNGTFTNAERISMSASGGSILVTFVKLPNTATFIPYAQFFTFTAAGRYEFFAQDIVGNTSNIYVIIVDRTPKPVTLSGVINDRTSENVTVSWINDSPLTTAPIVSVTVNGRSITSNGVIRTINGGAYVIESIDAAGNVWTADFTASRIEVMNNTINKQFWETADEDGNRFSFDTFYNAFVFAVARERSLIRTAVWYGDTWDGGIPMDNIDSVNAQNGKYFIYKMSGNHNVLVAYFTLERLNAVIAEFALQSVSTFYWWQRTPAQAYEGNNVHKLTAYNTFIGNSVTLAAHANYRINGVPFTGGVFSTEGEHILTVYDDWGNSYVFTLIIVRNVPEIWFRLEGGVLNLADSDIRYAFREAVTLKINSDFGADFAMLIIRNSIGEILAVVHHDEEFTLTSGRYFVTAINHAGLSSEIQFAISLNSLVITFVDNLVSKRLEVRIEPSNDIGATLIEIRIYRSIDGGLTWKRLETDNYNRVINTERLFFEFNRDGLYRVVVTDNFRSGIDAVISEFDYLKPPPVGTLHGVEDGGYTNGAVRFSWTDEAYVRLMREGIEIEYTSNREIAEEGRYVLEFFDSNGYIRIFTFTIIKALPVGLLNGVTNGGITNQPVWLEFGGVGIISRLYKDGVFIGTYEGGSQLTESGAYRITLTDRAGNETEFIFEIDTVMPSAELVGVTNGGRTGGNVTLRNPNKQVTVRAYLNGEAFAFSFGNVLTAEGSYRIILTDSAGNVTEYTFQIVYAVNAAGTIVIILIIGLLVGGITVVIVMRKRKAFKSKPKKNA